MKNYVNTTTKITMNYLKKLIKRIERMDEQMYSKTDLIENKKMEKILRANKYKTRNLLIKRAREEKIKQIITGIVFSLGFIAVMYIVAIIESINF